MSEKLSSLGEKCYFIGHFGGHLGNCTLDKKHSGICLILIKVMHYRKLGRKRVKNDFCDHKCELTGGVHFGIHLSMVH